MSYARNAVMKASTPLKVKILWLLKLKENQNMPTHYSLSVLGLYIAVEILQRIQWHPYLAATLGEMTSGRLKERQKRLAT